MKNSIWKIYSFLTKTHLLSFSLSLSSKVFHFQYFGNMAYRGFTEGKVWQYEGKSNYDQKLEQMKGELKSNPKNLPAAKIRELKNELTDFEVKKPKNDWLVACEQADGALLLSRAERIKALTFEYVGPKSRAADEESSDEEENVKSKSKLTTPKPKARKSTSDLKRSASRASGLKTPASKRKKKSSNSSPTDVYDFNESSSDEDEQPAKFELSSAKRAKGEFVFYAKQMRENVEKEYPKLSPDEIEKKLRRNWELMSEDMRNSYAPRSSQYTNHQNGKEEVKPRRSSLSKKSLPVFTTTDEEEVEVRANGDGGREKKITASLSTRSSRSSSRFKTPLKAEPTPAPASSSDKKAASPASIATTTTNSTNSTNNSKSNSIKSKSSSSNQLAAEENGISEDSLSCSSDEKAEQKEQKEQLCAKCGKLDKGLVPCEG